MTGEFIVTSDSDGVFNQLLITVREPPTQATRKVYLGAGATSNTHSLEVHDVVYTCTTVVTYRCIIASLPAFQRVRTSFSFPLTSRNV